MEEKTTQELIHQGFEDAFQWLREAPTPEAREYRKSIVLEAFSGRRMQTRWQSIEQSPRVGIPPDLQLPDWARRLENV